MKIEPTNTTIVPVHVGLGMNVRELPHRAQVLSVGTDPEGGLVLFVAGNRHSMRPDEVRSFYVVGEGEDLPEQEMRSTYFLGTVQRDGHVFHVFEVDVPHRPAYRRPAEGVSINQHVGNVAPGAGVMQIGSMGGDLVRHGGGVHIQ